jgi:hypothetical protein
MASHTHPASAPEDPALAPPPDDQNQALIDGWHTFLVTVIGVVLFVGSVFLFIF